MSYSLFVSRVCETERPARTDPRGKNYHKARFALLRSPTVGRSAEVKFSVRHGEKRPVVAAARVHPFVSRELTAWRFRGAPVFFEEWIRRRTWKPFTKPCTLYTIILIRLNREKHHYG